MGVFIEVVVIVICAAFIGWLTGLTQDDANDAAARLTANDGVTPGSVEAFDERRHLAALARECVDDDSKAR